MTEFFCRLAFHLRFWSVMILTPVRWDRDFLPQHTFELEENEIEDAVNPSCTKIEFFKTCACGGNSKRRWMDYEA